MSSEPHEPFSGPRAPKEVNPTPRVEPQQVTTPSLRLVRPEESEADLRKLDPDAVFRACARYVAVIAHRIVGDPDEADDVLQDVFVEFQKSRHRVRDPGAVRAWLATATVRIARRRLWRRRFIRVVRFEDADYQQAASPAASPEQRAEIAAIYRFLDTVPPAKRIAWVLRRIHGATLDEAASMCDVSLATVKRWISAVDARLKEEYGDE